MTGEVWDSIEYKPRYSRLFHLEPTGVGTAEIECLTGYFIRLADAHSLPPQVIITHEVLPHLHKHYLFKDGQHIHDALGKSWWRSLSITLNGLNSLTEDWVHVLQELTLRSDLRYLTLLTYRNVLPYRSLIRPQKAWCPLCYEEARIAGEPIYDRLIWMVEVVTACLKHRRPLQIQCPFSDCNQRISAVTPQGQIGFCPYCNRWLGYSFEVEPTHMSDQEWDNQRFVIDSVGEILASALSSSHLLRRNNIGESIRRYIDEELRGNASALARMLGVHHKTIYDWRDGKQLPQLKALINLSKVLNTTSLSILTGQLQNPILNNQAVLLADPYQKKPQRFNNQQVQQALQAQIAAPETPPPSMAQVAKRLGYDQAFLTNHFPELCTLISSRFADYRIEQKTLRIQRDCKKVRDVTQSIHAQGQYPSYKRVGKIIKGSFRDALVQSAYLKTMRDLGYKK